MKKESIEVDLSKAVKELLALAGSLTWNHIPERCLFILSEIKNSEQHPRKQFQIKVKENKSKKAQPLHQLIQELEELYPDLYDVNLYIYKATKKASIVEIQYYRRSSLSDEYKIMKVDQEPMLHSKVMLPVYNKKDKKFDLHWQFGTFNHQWNFFWWKLHSMKRRQ